MRARTWQHSGVPLAVAAAGAGTIARVRSARKRMPALAGARRLVCRANDTAAAVSDKDAIDVFLSHCWGDDNEGRDNHARVSLVNQKLKSQGLSTWFDEERMQGNLMDRMCNGIDQARLVICFMTQRYLEKVGSGDSRDNCRMEFNYAALRKGSNQMLACVMERGMRNTSEWRGPCGMILGGELYVDFAEDDAPIEQLVEAVMRRLRELDKAQADVSTPASEPIDQPAMVRAAVSAGLMRSAPAQVGSLLVGAATPAEAITAPELLPGPGLQAPAMAEALPPEPSPCTETQSGWLATPPPTDDQRARWDRVERDLRVSGAADWREAIYAMVGAEDCEAQTLRWIEYLIERELPVGIVATALAEGDAESEALSRDLKTLALLAGLPPKVSMLLKDKAAEVAQRR